ncbi:MAG: trigger factor [Firmicutes bacterium]|nr:trigger factor [Bacillota bacterium]
MSVVEKVERVEEDTSKCKYRLTFCAEPKKFEEACELSYQKNKGKYFIQGFRQGKAPRKMIEIQYGKGVFYEDAVERVLPEAYDAAAAESGLDIVLRPSIEVSEINAEKGVVFVAEVYVKPQVSLGDYIGLPYGKSDTEPTEEEIGERVDRDRDKNARTISAERPAQNGDIVTIDYTGYIDGEPFEGGEAKDHDLTIGSGSFVGGFEEQLAGMSAGEEKDVCVTFPEDYHGAEVAGKPAVFRVAVKDVKYRELPEADDEFAQDVSEFDTLEEYRKDIYEKIKTEKTARAKREKEDAVMRALLGKLIANIPEAMYENAVDDYVRNYMDGLYQRGYDPEKYMSYFGMTEETLRERYRPQAEETVKSRLALEAVAEAEGLEATEEDMAEEAAKFAAAYKVDAGMFLKGLDAKTQKSLKQDILTRKAFEFVVEKAVEE